MPPRLMRAAVIGVGHLGQQHARIYSELARRPEADVELVAVVDIVETQAKAVAERCRTRALTDFAPLVGQVDAVSVAVPTESHFAVAKPFLECGAAVLVEKPLTHSLADAEALTALAERRGAMLQVGHVERFNPAFTALAQYRLRPRFIECHRLSPFRFRSADVGVVFDLMIHDLDLVAHLADSPLERVEAVGTAVVTNHEDIANARLVFANGCVANVTASRVSLSAHRRLRIFTEDGYVSVDLHKRQAQIYRRSAELTRAVERARTEGLGPLMALKDREFTDLLRVEDIRIEDGEPLKREIESFLHCARTGARPVVSGAEGVRAVRMATRILEEIAKSPAATGAT